MRYKNLTAFLFAVILAHFLLLPQNAEAQTIPEWDQIEFENKDISVIARTDKAILSCEELSDRRRCSVWFNARFELGSAAVTESMRQAVKSNRSLYRMRHAKADAVLYEGFNDSHKNRQSDSRPIAEQSAPERYQTSDARLAELRAMTGRDLSISLLSKGYTMENIGQFMPSKVETGSFSMPDSLQSLTREELGDEFYLKSKRTFRIVMVNYNDNSGLALEEKIKKLRKGLRADMQKLRGRVDSLGQEHSQTQNLARTNSERIDSLETEVSSIDKSEKGLKVGFFAGAGLERFAGINSYLGEVGFRLGEAEAFGWYGRKSNVGTADLQDGPVTIHRETYGVGFNWYPLQIADNRIEFGPSAAFEHGEDFLDGREEYVRGYESGQLGLATQVRIWKFITLQGSVRYQVAQSFESTDLKLNPEESNVRAGVTVRVNL
jgi:hypothetical protein